MFKEMMFILDAMMSEEEVFKAYNGMVNAVPELEWFLNDKRWELGFFTEEALLPTEEHKCKVISWQKQVMRDLALKNSTHESWKNHCRDKGKLYMSKGCHRGAYDHWSKVNVVAKIEDRRIAKQAEMEFAELASDVDFTNVQQFLDGFKNMLDYTMREVETLALDLASDKMDLNKNNIDIIVSMVKKEYEWREWYKEELLYDALSAQAELERAFDLFETAKDGLEKAIKHSELADDAWKEYRG